MFDETILSAARRVLEACRKQGVMLVSAESCTGGLLAAALTSIPGSSSVFECGYVTYSYEAKTAILGVERSLIMVHGAVSGEVACAMASGICRRHPGRIGIAVTGVAGPGSDSQAKPAGLVHLAAVVGDNSVAAVKRYGDAGRHVVRLASVRDALALIEECLGS